MGPHAAEGDCRHLQQIRVPVGFLTTGYLIEQEETQRQLLVFAVVVRKCDAVLVYNLCEDGMRLCLPDGHQHLVRD